ncbi:hypothetical protein NOR_06741 [Metarhizium rileyi]|uniref:Uncharacterized protein n=1 Tax=Metarhizium rileyi (strain RCEF 4871) TaxID=1649241 RepID=A0A166ZXV8_METRR|nr:hypothetical protein NOR_06741 [Metarhizium rileyi RCEF 4871]TWU73350.1 hypothetical protein ED733_005136 [Metarhizium rileyi]
MPFREWATSLRSSSRRWSLDSSNRRVMALSMSIMDINDSERTLVGTLEVQDLHHFAVDEERQSSPSRRQRPQPTEQAKDAGSIERRIDYCVVEDDRYAVRFGNYTGVWAGNAGRSVPQTRSRYFGDHIHQHAYNLHASKASASNKA